jgi:hypothetical protein
MVAFMWAEIYRLFEIISIFDLIPRYIYKSFGIDSINGEDKKVPCLRHVLPVVLYGCETWSLTLREEHRLRVFENRMLRRIFRPKREEDGTWRKLHNDEIHDMYSSPNIVRVIKSRRMRWAGHVARMGRGEVLIGFWLGGPKARDHWVDLGVDGRITLRWTLGR